MALAAGICASVAVVVQARLSRVGIQPYGYDGAEFIEHRERLAVALALRDVGETGLRTAIIDADRDFPPLLHWITTVLVAPLGQDAVSATRTGVLWLALLGLAAGVVTWALAERRVSVASAAAVGCFLVPALHGFTTRYYYDLPLMALLWCVVAFGLAMRGRGVAVLGIGLGGLWFLACLIKWTALPLGPVSIGAVLLAAGLGSWRRRAAIGGTAVVVWALLLGGWVALLGAAGSLGGMLANWLGQMDADQAGAAAELGGLVGSALGVIGRVDPLARLQFYLLGTAFSVFSPLLFAATVALGVQWLRTGRAGAALLAVMVAGHGLFACFGVAVFDERFILGVAPALVIAGALGWGALPTRLRSIVGVALVVLGLVLAVEHHHVGQRVGEARIENRAPDSFANHVRGPWVADPVERRGWGHHDGETGRGHLELEALWGAVVAAQPQAVLVVGDPDLDQAALPSSWLDYRRRLDALQRGGAPIEVRYGSDCDGVDLAVTRGDGIAPAPPPCAGDWTARVTLARPGDRSQASVWVLR